MSRTRTAAIVFGCALAGKLLLLAVFGPLIAPDTPAYIDYAKAILTDASWRTRADLGSSFAPDLVFRMVGYPLVVAAFESLSPLRWQGWLIAFQILISALASARLYVVFERISQNRKLALGLAFAHATAINLVFDQFILTDAIYLALWIFATCSIVEISLDREASWCRLCEISAAFLGCFLLREVTGTLVLLWLPLLVIALARVHRLGRSLMLAALVLTPVFSAQQAYNTWNVYRTGERFVTTSYQLVLLQPLVNAARYDRSIFGGSEPLDVVARPVLSRFGYDEAYAISVALHRDYGWNALHNARELERRYWQAWRQHPVAMLRAMSERFRFGYLMALVAPLSSLNMTLSWTGAAENNALSFSTLSRKTFKEGRIQYALLWLFDILCRLASLAIFVTVAAAAATAAWRIRELGKYPLVLEMLAMTALAGGFFGAHALVHVEERYLMPIFPVILMAFAIAIRMRAELFQPLPLPHWFKRSPAQMGTIRI